MALTNKLSAIGDAIRAKTGKSDLLTLDQMPAEIESIETGGSSEGSSEIILTGDLAYLFSKAYLTGTADAALQQYEQLIGYFPTLVTGTKDVTKANNMFSSNTYLTEIPFDINLVEGTNVSCASMFSGAQNLVKAPKINGKAGSINSMFYNCYNLKDVSALENIELSGGSCGQMFYSCFNLRNIPSSFLKQLGRGTSTTNSYVPGYNPFNLCYLLDEVVDFGVTTATYTSNKFSSIAYYTWRLKKWTFETNEDGTPKTANWHTQTLDFSSYCGYVYQTDTFQNRCPDFYSTATQITNDATYASLKDNPDAWTKLVAYCRYNHDSAVETINSLPDTSAYLAANSGKTNTIKFKGSAGSSTDGGAINTLTEEEIAVAAAKGWTVSLV